MSGDSDKTSSISIAAFAGTNVRVGRGVRSEVLGQRGALSVGHHLVANVGMDMLKRGGTAIDAGLAMVLAANVVEFTSCGFGGEVPTLIYSAKEKRVVAINGNMCAPLAASPTWFRERGYRLIPPDGFLPAGVCAVPAAVILMLDRYGRFDFQSIAQGAINLAEEGFPVDQRWRTGILSAEKRFLEEWPTSAELFLIDNKVPEVGQVWKNPPLANTLRRLVKIEQWSLNQGADRSSALRAVHDHFYRGPIAEEICRFTSSFRVRDREGGCYTGLLTEEDFARYRARIEEPWRLRYRGYDVYKCGPWTQGPVFLQQLALLEGYDLAGMEHNSTEYLHLWLESAKLAHADKEKYYADPEFAYVPRKGLLSPEYAAVRRKLIDRSSASRDLRPGDPFLFDNNSHRRSQDLSLRSVQPLKPDSGTTGVRVIDAEGNMFSATPSGGWLQDSPIIPELGFALGTRCQMFYLEDGLAKTLAPGKQPCSSLSPTLIMDGENPRCVFGMPGADRQDQGSLQFFLNIIDFGMGIQEALDAPRVWTSHFPSLFYPREAHPARAHLEGRFDPSIAEGLRALGHEVIVEDPWTGDYTMVVMIHPGTGTKMAAVSPRWITGSAMAW